MHLLVFQNTCIFGAYHENLNEDRLNYYEPCFSDQVTYLSQSYLQNIFVVCRHQQRCAEADCENHDPQNIVDLRKDCGSLVDKKLRALHRWNLKNKANISITQSLIAFPLTPKHVTLNGHFAVNSVLRQYVWSAEAWLSKLGYS